ncbi:MAG: 30S ribosomal protein S8 [Chlamydiia bacterium]|nr:30S ribosomal protein S8 [Chlamydiia bacterium]
MRMTSDPIADLLTRIRNGSKAKCRFVDVPWSTIKENIVKILKNEGYVAHVLVKEENKKKTMRIFLRYASGRQPVLNGLKRVSKPSLRRYVSSKAIPNVMRGMGTAILSTPKGVVEGRTAVKENVGGELICYAW